MNMYHMNLDRYALTVQCLKLIIDTGGPYTGYGVWLGDHRTP